MYIPQSDEKPHRHGWRVPGIMHQASCIMLAQASGSGARLTAQNASVPGRFDAFRIWYDSPAVL